MYILVRLLIGILFFLCSTLIINNALQNHKGKKLVTAAIASVVLVTGLSLFPVENCFITFDSPEAAFRYYTGNSNIVLVIDGQSSNLVIGQNGNVDTMLIIPKTTDGWKIGTGMDTQILSQVITDDAVIYLYQSKNTGDHYITVLGISDNNLDVSDSINSLFYTCKSHNADQSHTTMYAAIIFDHQYHITINGSTVSYEQLMP